MPLCWSNIVTPKRDLQNIQVSTCLALKRLTLKWRMHNGKRHLGGILQPCFCAFYSGPSSMWLILDIIECQDLKTNTIDFSKILYILVSSLFPMSFYWLRANLRELVRILHINIFCKYLDCNIHLNTVFYNYYLIINL